MFFESSLVYMYPPVLFFLWLSIIILFTICAGLGRPFLFLIDWHFEDGCMHASLDGVLGLSSTGAGIEL